MTYSRIGLITLLLLAMVPALAWNGATHMLTASIAYSTLQAQNPAALKKMVTLLQAHPAYPHWVQYDLPDVPATERDRYLLMLAATWADEIRSDHAYDAYNHPEWHYVDYPFTPGMPYSWAAPTLNLLTGYAAELKVLQSRAAPARRAIALSWILHLVGDAHCPLHAITLVTADYPAPEGDRGGNRFYVRTKPGNRSAVKLHSLWDGLVLSSDRYQTVRNRDTLLRATYPQSALPAAKETRIETVLKTESFPLAVKYAYLNGTLAGSTRPDGAPALMPSYFTDARPVAEKQVTLAGYRMAGILGSTLK